MHYTEERFRNEVKEIVSQAIADAVKEIDMPAAPEYLTREEAAKTLKISLPTLTKLTKEGRIRGYKIGRHIRYKSQELDMALQEITSLKYQRHNY